MASEATETTAKVRLLMDDSRLAVPVEPRGQSSHGFVMVAPDLAGSLLPCSVRRCNASSAPTAGGRAACAEPAIMLRTRAAGHDAPWLCLCALTFELSRPRRQGPLADQSNMLLGFGRPVGLAGAGRLERRVRRQQRTRLQVTFHVGGMASRLARSRSRSASAMACCACRISFVNLSITMCIVQSSSGAGGSASR